MMPIGRSRSELDFLFSRIQNVANLRSKMGIRKRFRDKMKTGVQTTLVYDRIPGISSREKNFDFRTQFVNFGSDLGARQTARQL